MDWLSQNGLFVLFFGGMIAMHLFGHKGHGHSGGCCGGGHHESNHSDSTSTSSKSTTNRLLHQDKV